MLPNRAVQIKTWLETSLSSGSIILCGLEQNLECSIISPFNSSLKQSKHFKEWWCHCLPCFFSPSHTSCLSPTTHWILIPQSFRAACQMYLSNTCVCVIESWHLTNVSCWSEWSKLDRAGTEENVKQNLVFALSDRMIIQKNKFIQLVVNGYYFWGHLYASVQLNVN